MTVRRPLSVLLIGVLLTVALVMVMVRTSSVAAPPPGLALIAEPQAGSAPFLALIAQARRSIDLTMYELEDPRIEAALAAAAGRGVDVRVLLNGDYDGEPGGENRAAFTYLAAHRVHVRTTPTSFAVTHQKTLTVDGRLSAVMTLNFDGLYASTRDDAILDRQGADVAAISAVFAADWAARPITLSDGTGDLVWSPGAQTRVLAMINSARRSIDLENEEMAYAPATDALCAAARRGVNVEIIMTYASQWRSAFDQLAGCGAHIRLYYGQSYYIHAKLLEVDQGQALVSSQNLSTTSLKHNRELGIEVHTPALVQALRADFARDERGAEPWSG